MKLWQNYPWRKELLDRASVGGFLSPQSDIAAANPPVPSAFVQPFLNSIAYFISQWNKAPSILLFPSPSPALSEAALTTTKVPI
jgi:hypothetical protein